MPWDAYYKIMLALTMWREARGEGRDGMRAVGHVIRNRVNGGFGDWDHVITGKWQFSSLTAPGDSQLVRWPDSPDDLFETAMDCAEAIFYGGDADITNGATYYANLEVCDPKWAHQYKQVAKLGRHTFFRPDSR